MVILFDKPRAYLDVETTGLDPSVHEIIEFGVCYSDGRPGYNLQVKPLNLDAAHPRALEITGYNDNEWRMAFDPSEAAQRIADALRGYVLVGHNVNFDISFIQALLDRYGINARLGHHKVDTITLAYEHLVPVGLKSVSLKNVCLFIGIKPEGDVHRAMAGAARARRVYQKLVRSGWARRLWWGLLWKLNQLP